MKQKRNWLRTLWTFNTQFEIMIETRNSKTKLTRELTFEEWLERDYEYCPFNEDENWWIENDEHNHPGVIITYLLDTPEWEKAKEHLRNQYWKRVNTDFGLFKGSIRFSWQKSLDPVLIEREIDALNYSLYPEKYHSKPLPINITLSPYSKERLADEGLGSYKQIATAYAAIQQGERLELQTHHETIENGHCVAEATKRLLDWLLKFKTFLDSSGRRDKLAFEYFESKEENLAIKRPANEARPILSARQAAMVLRYQGKVLIDPNSSAGHNTDAIAYKMTGKNSENSGLHLYRKWRATNCKPEYYQGLSEKYLIDAIGKGTLNNHIKDLKAVKEYFAGDALQERVIADCNILKSVLEDD